jgi:hypothetical protein
MTTKALYYENFRMRALQEGRITIDDFVSVDEKIMNDAFGQYNNQNPNGTYYTNPTPNAYEQSTGDVNTEQNSAPTENQAPTNFTDDYYVNPLEHQNDNQNDNQQ